MCGIAGELAFDGDRADRDAVAAMTVAMADRGPDGEGAWCDGWVALGHRRLSVIDLTERGAQPMVDAELGLTVVFNGCIYNHHELRRELSAAHRFVSTSDTEVVLKAYAEWGDDFVDHLIGMFALVLVDQRRDRVVLARDRLGIKPLYLADSRGRLRFASSLPALLAGGGIDTSIDDVALHHYLSWHSIVPAPRTILRGVHKLPPATVRVVERDGRSSERTYWHPPYVRDPERDDWSPRDWEDAIGDALRLAVRRRLVADVPVGVLLSGGLDSSVLVALLAEEASGDVDTFSIGFREAGGESGDEFEFSDAVADAFATRHHRRLVDADELVPAVLGAVDAMTEPMGSHDVPAFYLLAEWVAEHDKVVQSGQGADEILAGYGYHQRLGDAGPDEAYTVFSRAFVDRPHAALTRVLEPEHLVPYDASGELLRSWMSGPLVETALDAGLHADTHLLMPDDPVKRVDSMTMASGLEARVPFLDHELVELAATCPPELKLHDGGKGVLKALGRRVLPTEVVDRPKGYFPVPALRHLDGPVLDMVREALRAPEATARGVFRGDYVDVLLAEPNREFSPGRANLLWQIGVLELWLQRHGVR
ncbi:N-acetylglutaminylglutamine amidotransferase [Desertivibrio insolitus]|uniref:N-acetylglutaminylglutamine amidotransferase n=1 Tax=Herbiconiux sp. SYSU D00978 TaxID=2812562 RepID=UPI001A964C8C|nr:N-acetylglutaminylglutamine amidotransferase [Herbiconiux sp. SYSU D00978]